MTIRALLLLSGGLDSTLAIRVLQNAGIEVTAISFVSHFFGSAKAKIAAQKMGVELREFEFKQEHLAVVKNPVYGYGQWMNPCIDCHGLMFAKAGEIMKKEGFDFLASGEVLGERPKSQTRSALKCVDKLSGVAGYIVRPLSAKLLEPTIPEMAGKIDRSKMLDLSGKGRKRQIQLAADWGITDYPTPAGGCLLTEGHFATNLKTLLNIHSEPDVENLALLKLGRHFWHNDNQIVLGRDQDECENKLPQLISTDDVVVELAEDNGPLAVIHGKKIDQEAIDYTIGLIKKYAKIPETKKMKIKITKAKVAEVVEI